MTLPPSVRVAPTCNTSPLGLEVVSALNDFFSLDCFHDVDLGSISPVYETVPRGLSEGCGLLLLLVVLPSVWLCGLWQSLWCGAWLLVLEHLLAPLLAIFLCTSPRACSEAFVSTPCVAVPSVDVLFFLEATMRFGVSLLPIAAFVLGLFPLLGVEPLRGLASETDEGLSSVSTPCVTVLTALGVLISLKDTARGGVLVWPLLAVALGPFPLAGAGPLRLLAPKFVDEMLDSPIFGAAVSALIPSFASFLGALPSL